MIYYFDSVYVIGGLALLFLILLAFLKFMKRKSNMYLLCFSVMYIYLCVVLDLTQFPIYASEGMKAAMGGQNVWREMNLIPLKTIVTDFSMESVLNIIVTIPLGFGLSFLMRCSWRQIMLSGVLLGYGVFKIFRNVFQWGYKKLETNSNAFLSYIKCVCDDNSDALLK